MGQPNPDGRSYNIHPVSQGGTAARHLEDASAEVDDLGNVIEGQDTIPSVDLANDLLLIHDATDGMIYKVVANQVGGGGTPAGGSFNIDDGTASTSGTFTFDDGDST